MKIVFDFDGTLVDSMPKLREIATRIIAYGYNMHINTADQSYMSCVGMSFREQLEFIWPCYKGNDALARRFYEEQEVAYDSVQLHPGVIDTIEFLNTTPISYGAASSTHGRLANDVIKRLLPEFSGIVTGRDYGSKLSQLKSHFGRTDSKKRWFIGDSPFDGNCAIEAGSEFIGVTHTFPFSVWGNVPFNLTNSIPMAIDGILRETVGPVQMSLTRSTGLPAPVPVRSLETATG